jgi:hypothetical protein
MFVAEKEKKKREKKFQKRKEGRRRRRGREEGRDSAILLMPPSDCRSELSIDTVRRASSEATRYIHIGNFSQQFLSIFPKRVVFQ